MTMYAFDFVRPASLADASAALAKSGAKALAGGQSLVAAMKLRLAQPGTLVDLSQLAELKGITKDSNSVTIGASGIGDRQIRNMGTIGGSIAHNDPTACYPAALLALGAAVRTNRRTIVADDFFTGMFETALEQEEIITSVSFPIPKKAAYVKFPNPASRFALVGVFVAQTTDGVRVAVTGAASCAFRSKPLESALAKSFTADAAKATTIGASGLNGDLHASPEYRAHLIPVLAARAVAAAG
jgi:carbon-monoxide dehydrogenase medium subunit